MPTPEARRRRELITRWVTLVATAILIVVAIMANASYTNRVDERSDRDWCELLDTLDAPSPAPTTERGERLRRQIHALRERKGCLHGDPG